MTDRTRTQLGVLGALVAVFVTVMFVVSRGEGPAGRSVAPSNQPGRAGGPPGPPEVADVNLEALRRAHEAPADPDRNLFVFRPRAPRPAPRAVEESSPVVVPSAPAGPPPPPPIPLKFIGVLERGGSGGKVAILSDGRGSTFHAREGEDVDGRYRVMRIGTDSIELSYVDGRGRQTLRLSGQ
ncbi:MAG: hypothetical protein ACRD26_22425 [Vicinamibacterales bacterium]